MQRKAAGVQITHLWQGEVATKNIDGYGKMGASGGVHLLAFWALVCRCALYAADHDEVAGMLTCKKYVMMANIA